MAQEVVGIKIQVNGQEKVLSSMGEIRKELKQAQFDVLKFSEAFGESSKEAVEAAKRVAQLKDAIGDAKDLVGAFNPDAKFRAFSGAVQGVTGGFAALQGAMGLLGTESKDVEKMLLKVQSALALSEGLNSVMGSIDAFKNLGAVIKSTTVFQKANELANRATAASMRLLGVTTEATSTSFRVLKTAIVSTGIGVLVIALGEAIAAFQNYQSSADKAAEAQKNLNEKIKQGADTALKAEQEYLTNQEKIDVARAKARGASEKEIFDIEQKYRKLKGESQIRYWKETKDADAAGAANAKSEVAKINAEGIAAQADFDAKQREKAIQKQKEKDEKDKQLAKEKAEAEKEAAERIAKLKGEIEVAGIKNEYDAKRKEIENQLAIDIKQVNDNEKLKVDTKKALITELEKKASADIRKVVTEEMDAANKDYAERQKKYAEDERALRLAELQSKFDDLDAENEKYDQDFEADQERIAMQQEILAEQRALELENAENDALLKFEIEQKYSDKKNELKKEEVETEKAAKDAKLKLNLEYIDLYAQFGALLSQVAGKNKALAIAGLVIEKGAAIAKVITQMNTVQPFLPGGIPNPSYIPARIAGGLSIAAIVAAAAQGLQTINSAGVPGGSGGSTGGGGSVATGAAAPIAPPAPQATVTRLDNQSINQMGNATNRAYVIESDVTNSQERIKRINRAARLT